MRYAWVLGWVLVSFEVSASERWTAPYALEDQQGRTFRVILGAKAPEDVQARLGVMTLLGKKGMATARLQRVEAVCVDLCEAARPTCHSVGVYTQEPGTGNVGEGLVALPGRVQGKLAPPSPTGPTKRPLAGHWVSNELQVPVDEQAGDAAPSDGLPRRAYRWTRHADGRVVPESRTGPEGPLHSDYTLGDFELASCRQEQQPPFTRLTCPGASFLYAKPRLLVASFDDYGQAATEWVATLRTGGQELYLIRVGLKAQAVIGLLFQDEGRWRLLIRPADYSLLC